MARTLTDETEMRRDLEYFILEQKSEKNQIRYVKNINFE